VDEPSDRRRAHGARLALTMADVEAGFGDFGRARFWSGVAEGQLGHLPGHYRDRHADWLTRSVPTPLPIVP
jgi:hypothetical protein